MVELTFKRPNGQESAMSKKIDAELVKRIKEAFAKGKSEQEVMDEFFASQGHQGRQPKVARDEMQQYVNRVIPILDERKKKKNPSSVGKYTWVLLFHEKTQDLTSFEDKLSVLDQIPDYPQIANLLTKGELTFPKPDATPVEQNAEEESLEQAAIEAGASKLDAAPDQSAVLEETPSGEPVTVTTVSEGVVNTKTVNPPKHTSKSKNRSRAKAHA